MKKCYLCIVLALCLSLGLTQTAFCSDLGGMAVIAEAGIVYSGYGDDGSEGVFLIDPDAGVKKLHDEQARILAVSDSYALAAVADGGDIKLIILGLDGTVAGSLNITAFEAAAYEDSFFVDRYKIDVVDGKAEMSELLAGEYVYPVAAHEGFLYYLDGSKYEEISAMDGLDNISALCRIDLETGEAQQVADEGAVLVGFDGESVIYALKDFYIYENDDVKMMSFGRGLYKADLDGKNAVLLKDIGSYDDGYFDEYTVIEDSVVYGVRHDYASDDLIPPMHIVRASLDGSTLEDIPVDIGTLISVQNNWAYMCATRYSDEYEYLYDDIMAVDTDAGEDMGRDVPLLGSKRMRLNYSEEGVRAMMTEDGYLYFVAIVEDEDSPRLWLLDPTGEPRPIAKLD